MTAVEICVECDIADCHHIRARRAAAAAHHKEPRVTEELNGGCLDEREAFEAWAGDQGFVLTRTAHGDEYQDLRTQGSWEGFQIGRASLSTSKQAGAEPVALPTDEEMREGFREYDWSVSGAKNQTPWQLWRDGVYWGNRQIIKAAPGAAIAAREQEVDLSIERLGVPTMESELRFVHANILPDYSPNYKNSTMFRRIEAALASREEAPVTPKDQS
jgi:hypothetical protein